MSEIWSWQGVPEGSQMCKLLRWPCSCNEGLSCLEERKSKTKGKNRKPSRLPGGTQANWGSYSLTRCKNIWCCLQGLHQDSRLPNWHHLAKQGTASGHELWQKPDPSFDPSLHRYPDHSLNPSNKCNECPTTQSLSRNAHRGRPQPGAAAVGSQSKPKKKPQIDR